MALPNSHASQRACTIFVMTEPRGRLRSFAETHEQAAPDATKLPFLFARQRVLLGLAAELGGKVTNLDFQQLLFLYSQVHTATRPYDFVPGEHGAFSFTAYADRNKLVERGLLVDDEHHWQVTALGRRIARSSADAEIAAFARRHKQLRGDALLADAVHRYPYYASRSTTGKRLLRGDHLVIEQHESSRTRGKRLQTIGYEGHTLESYLDILLRTGVTLLCDVRRNPLSRKYGFSKRALAAACATVGVRYEHLPALGISSDKRQRLESQADYDALFCEYENESLPKQAVPLAEIADWIRGGDRVALTCYEHLPHQCHRHCVAEALESKYGKHFAPKHL